MSQFGNDAVQKDILVVLRARDEATAKLKDAEKQIKSLNGELAKTRAETEKMAGTSQAAEKFYQTMQKVTRIGGAIAAMRVGFDGVTAAIKAMNGEGDKAIELVERLPLGIGGVAQSLKGLLGELTGANAELARLERLRGRIEQSGQFASKAADARASARGNDVLSPADDEYNKAVAKVAAMRAKLDPLRGPLNEAINTRNDAEQRFRNQIQEAIGGSTYLRNIQRRQGTPEAERLALLGSSNLRNLKQDAESARSFETSLLIQYRKVEDEVERASKAVLSFAEIRRDVLHRRAADEQKSAAAQEAIEKARKDDADMQASKLDAMRRLNEQELQAIKDFDDGVKELDERNRALVEQVKAANANEARIQAEADSAFFEGVAAQSIGLRRVNVRGNQALESRAMSGRSVVNREADAQVSRKQMVEYLKKLAEQNSQLLARILSGDQTILVKDLN